MLETLFAAYGFHSLPACFHGTRVAPDDGVAYRFHIAVEGHEPVHLIAYANAGDLGNVSFCAQVLDSLAHIAPPHFRVLLGPARMESLDGHFTRRVGGRCNAFSAFDVKQ